MAKTPDTFPLATPKLEQKYRALRTLVFFVWIAGAAYIGIGTHRLWGAHDGIGYGITDGDTAAKWIFLCSVAAMVLALTFAKFRWKFGLGVSFLLGLAMPFLVFMFSIWLVPRHFAELCDNMDAMRACDAATWSGRDTCEPGEACFPRIEKACRLGSEEACSALITQGHWSQTQACGVLKDRCDELEECRGPDVTGTCPTNDLLLMESLKFSPGCRTYERICGSGDEPTHP
jgi:hypothetical protein